MKIKSLLFIFPTVFGQWGTIGAQASAQASVASTASTASAASVASTASAASTASTAGTTTGKSEYQGNSKLNRWVKLNGPHD